MTTNNCHPIDQKQNRDDLVYIVNSTKPFTGSFCSYTCYSKIHHIESFINGRMDGPSITYFENGQKSSEEFYKNGKKDDSSIRWYKNGQKSSSINFINGRMDGLFVRWHKNGQQSVEESFANGKKEGPSIRWNKNGKKTLEGYVRNYKKVGKWHGRRGDGWSFVIDFDYRDGDELAVDWYHNGVKKRVERYKNEGEFFNIREHKVLLKNETSQTKQKNKLKERRLEKRQLIKSNRNKIILKMLLLLIYITHPIFLYNISNTVPDTTLSEYTMKLADGLFGLFLAIAFIGAGIWFLIVVTISAGSIFSKTDSTQEDMDNLFYILALKPVGAGLFLAIPNYLIYFIVSLIDVL